jgi:uncharacterized protein (DUF2235 family)
MGKNIVICLDGTGNEVKARGSSNVLELVGLLDLSDPEAQIAYYDPGVGTFAAPGASTGAAQALSRLGGLALGHGLRQNLGEAYTFLMNTYEPGDSVYVFGFSRGAYTARALCGMVYRMGLLRPGSENLVPYAVRVYARHAERFPDKDKEPATVEDKKKPSKKDPEWARMDRFAEALSVRPKPHSRSLALPIAFLGLFDTVKATRFLGRDIHWPYTNQLPNVAVVRHAVSIDEKRRPYRESLVTGRQDKPPKITETWFAGVHSDIGGSFETHRETGRLTLRWMVDGATATGLRFRTRMLPSRAPQRSDVQQPINHMGWIWRLAGTRRRPIPGGARVHVSVRDRMAIDERYRPTLLSDPVWDDESWPAEPARNDP